MQKTMQKRAQKIMRFLHYKKLLKRLLAGRENRTITERNPIEEKREEENKNTNNNIISIWGIEVVAMWD